MLKATTTTKTLPFFLSFFLHRRARLEHQSAIKAMQNRHAKGLLTPAEEVVLAKEMALMQERKSSGQDCVVL